MGSSCSKGSSVRSTTMFPSNHLDELFVRRRPTLKKRREKAISKCSTAIDVPQYDIDDDLPMELEGKQQLPKFARVLIQELDEEESNIDGDLIDPILLTKIRTDSIKYEFIRENGTKQLFRASSLIDYMLATGHFHDPETRIPFTTEQLVELDKLGEKLGKNSLLIARDWVTHEEELEDADAFSGVERLAGEHIYEMLQVIEATKRSHAQEAEMDLVFRVFPFFRYYVSLMYKLSREETKLAVDQYKRFLTGPPNRPTVDKSKVLLSFCLDFLDEVMQDMENNEG